MNKRLRPKRLETLGKKMEHGGAVRIACACCTLIAGMLGKDEYLDSTSRMRRLTACPLDVFGRG